MKGRRLKYPASTTAAAKVVSLVSLLSIVLFGCSDTNKPDPDPPSTPGLCAGSVEPEVGLRDSFSELVVHALSGSTQVRSDGTFTITIDTTMVRQPIVVAFEDGPPVLMTFIDPIDAPTSIGANETATALVSIDPLLWMVPDGVKQSVLTAAHSDLSELVGLIRARLSTGAFDYLVDDSDLGVQRAAAELLRNSALKAGFLLSAEKHDSLKTQPPPWFEAALPGEDDLTVVNPHTIQYGVGIHEYFDDSRRSAFISKAADLATLRDIGSPARTTFDMPDGRYRFITHHGREGSWGDRGSPEYIAVEANIISAAKHYTETLLNERFAEPWLADPQQFPLRELPNVDDLRSALSDKDVIGFQVELSSFLLQNRAVLLPEIAGPLMSKVHAISIAYSKATTGMQQGRFLEDLLTAPAGESYYAVLEGNSFDEIDPPTVLQQPQDLIAHYSNGGVHLEWEDRATNEDGYLIERKTYGFYDELVTLTEGAHYYRDNHVILGWIYTYRVLARNAVAESAPSNEVTVTIRDIGDETPPATVRDLEITDVGDDFVELTWMAPGDDGYFGFAEQYDIRHDSSEITESSWPWALQLVREPWPKVGGSIEVFRVTGLLPGRDYHFALKTRDEMNNWSGLSNGVYAMTLPDTPEGGWMNGFAPYPAGMGVNSAINDMLIYNGDLIAGGTFTFAGGVHVNYLARWDGASWHALGQGFDGWVRGIGLHGGDLIAGGHFERADGSAARGVARWDGVAWHPLGLGVDGHARAAQTFQGDLIVGGTFEYAGGVPAANIARWDGSSWWPLGSGMSNQVFRMMIFEGDLIVAGDFGRAGGVEGTSEIARWDGENWSPIGGGMDLDYVDALGIYDGELIAGGQFNHAGGVPASNIARWDGEAWSPLGAGTDYWVRDLAVYGGDLIVAGDFLQAGGISARYIARWDGSSWSNLGSGTDGPIRALQIYGDALAAGGWFTVAGGKSSKGIAMWSDP